MESAIPEEQHPAVGLARYVIVFIFLVFAFGKCVGASCTVELEEESKSPDSRFLAVSWDKSCGGAVGLSRANVSIFRAGEVEQITVRSEGNVFECDSASAKATWVDNKTLRLESFQRCGTDSRGMVKDEFLGIRILRQFSWKDEDVIKD